MQREKEPWRGGGERGWGQDRDRVGDAGVPSLQSGYGVSSRAPLPDPRTHGVSAGQGTDRETSEVLARRNMNSTENKPRAGSC